MEPLTTMTFQRDQHHEELVQEVASRMESSKLSRRSSRNSAGQTPSRHSARIEKPRSNHASPRGLERRRTVSTKQYATLDDHYRLMFGLDDAGNKEAESGKEYQSARPVSWHPSSSQFQEPSAARIPGRPSLQSYQATEQSITSNILPKQPTQIFSDGYLQPQQYQQYEILPPYNNDHQLALDNTWSSYMHGQVTADSEPPAYLSLSSQVAWSASNQTQHIVAALQYNQTNSRSFPIQQSRAEDEMDSTETRPRLLRKKSDELIGLGLYDPPETSPPPFVPGFSTMGKGLKLEETWQPPEDMEDDEDDEEESSDEEVEEPVQQNEQQWAPRTSLPHVNMSGHTFFFEDEETVANEWWYYQLKQAAPQDGSTAYTHWF